MKKNLNSVFTKFLLTRLLRGATKDGRLYFLEITHFYSRASCEARPWSAADGKILQAFLLTRLLRGATSDSVSVHVVNEYFYSRASCEARHVVNE